RTGTGCLPGLPEAITLLDSRIDLRFTRQCSLRVVRRLLSVEREGGRGGRALERIAGRQGQVDAEAQRLAGARGQGPVTRLRALRVVTHELAGGRVEVAAVELRPVEVVARHARRGDVDRLDGEDQLVLQ